MATNPQILAALRVIHQAQGAAHALREHIKAEEIALRERLQPTQSEIARQLGKIEQELRISDLGDRLISLMNEAFPVDGRDGWKIDADTGNLVGICEAESSTHWAFKRIGIRYDDNERLPPQTGVTRRLTVNIGEDGFFERLIDAAAEARAAKGRDDFNPTSPAGRAEIDALIPVINEELFGEGAGRGRGRARVGG